MDPARDHDALDPPPSSVAAEAPTFGGKYIIEGTIGQGGMGLVQQARHARLGHRVAIKVLGAELRDNEDIVKRFEREARAAGALSSPHAVRVHDIDVTEDGAPFIVMELLAGSDLGRILARDGSVSPTRAASWIVEACDALGEAHRIGIVHRDLKPSNLFLADTEFGPVIKVLDFGIAKQPSKSRSITQPLAPLGTPQYMSPEQVRCAKDVDARSDVWSLGICLFELVTGQTPFDDESSMACIAKVAADPVPDPRTLRADLPEDFVRVVMRALEKDPEARYRSADELALALKPFAEVDAQGHDVSAVRRVRMTSRPRFDLDLTPTIGPEDVGADVVTREVGDDVGSDAGAPGPSLSVDGSRAVASLVPVQRPVSRPSFVWPSSKLRGMAPRLLVGAAVLAVVAAVGVTRFAVYRAPLAMPEAKSADIVERSRADLPAASEDPFASSRRSESSEPPRPLVERATPARAVVAPLGTTAKVEASTTPNAAAVKRSPNATPPATTSTNAHPRSGRPRPHGGLSSPGF